MIGTTILFLGGTRTENQYQQNCRQEYPEYVLFHALNIFYIYIFANVIFYLTTLQEI